jgi:hypothetical protein
MKRFWLVLLSLGLVMAFSVSAFAVDVKVSGEYYVAGLYLDKVSLQNTPDTYDTAFLFQRMRIGTDFIVSDSLKLVTRFDAMEREWGMRGGADSDPQPAGVTYANTVKPRTQENIEFDLAYVNYTSPIGLFQVGYMTDYAWGTIWGNRETGPTAGQIKYFLPIGPVTMVFAYADEADFSLSAKQNTVFAEDLDYDSYRVGPILKFKTDAAAGEVGILFIFNNIRNHRKDADVAPSYPYHQDGYVFQPYFKTNIGPLFLQGELNYYTGKRYAETTLVKDQDIDALSFWLDGDAKFGIVGVGGSLAFVQGDNNGAADGKMNNALTGGRDWDPCLIMFNNTVLNSWAGAIAGYNSTSVNGEMTNAWFFQGRFNVTPVPAFTAGMSLSYAFADKDLGSGTDRGLEVDVTGTYKITNNLSYMLGVGYLFTGDYYKGSTAGADVNNDYLVINKLTLQF